MLAHTHTNLDTTGELDGLAGTFAGSILLCSLLVCTAVSRGPWDFTGALLVLEQCLLLVREEEVHTPCPERWQDGGMSCVQLSSCDVNEEVMPRWTQREGDWGTWEDIIYASMIMTLMTILFAMNHCLNSTNQHLRGNDIYSQFNIQYSFSVTVTQSHDHMMTSLWSMVTISTGKCAAMESRDTESAEGTVLKPVDMWDVITCALIDKMKEHGTMKEWRVCCGVVIGMCLADSKGMWECFHVNVLEV